MGKRRGGRRWIQLIRPEKLKPSLNKALLSIAEGQHYNFIQTKEAAIIRIQSI